MALMKNLPPRSVGQESELPAGCFTWMISEQLWPLPHLSPHIPLCQYFPGKDFPDGCWFQDKNPLNIIIWELLRIISRSLPRFPLAWGRYAWLKISLLSLPSLSGHPAGPWHWTECSRGGHSVLSFWVRLTCYSNPHSMHFNYMSVTITNALLSLWILSHYTHKKIITKNNNFSYLGNDISEIYEVNKKVINPELRMLTHNFLVSTIKILDFFFLLWWLFLYFSAYILVFIE